jgi:hypothetical protein
MTNAIRWYSSNLHVVLLAGMCIEQRFVPTAKKNTQQNLQYVADDAEESSRAPTTRRISARLIVFLVFRHGTLTHKKRVESVGMLVKTCRPLTMRRNMSVSISCNCQSVLHTSDSDRFGCRLNLQCPTGVLGNLSLDCFNGLV